jgi:hypothetical protein
MEEKPKRFICPVVEARECPTCHKVFFHRYEEWTVTSALKKCATHGILLIQRD